MKISQIIIDNRIRKHLGDIQSLADSINSIGLLHPIVVTPDNKLVAGYRRIKAFQLLGKSEIPHRVIYNLDDLLKFTLAERDENTCRLDFTPSEAVEIGRVIEPLEREAAKKRELKGRGRPKKGENFTPISDGKKSLDKVSQAVGMSRPTYNKAKKVVDFVEKNPEFDYIAKEMDETGKVDRAAKEVNRMIKKKKMENTQVDIPSSGPVWHGDFVKLGKNIPDNSIDLIFTDPPYGNKAIDLYENLAVLSARVLKPSGMCLAYAGQGTLPQVLNVMSNHIKYMWTFSIQHSGGFNQMFAYNIRNQWKPIIAFYKLPLSNWWEWINDNTNIGKKEKDDHEWQQSIEEAKYFIRYFAPNNATILDPFCGSGTTLVAAKQLGFKFIGIEDDLEDCQRTIKRLEDIG